MIEDGLQGYEFFPYAYYKSISGEMFFGGSNGFNAFYPQNVKDNPHIPPGDYVFRVKGSNSDGVWNEKGASIAISISPAYWQTWWFKLFAAISLLVILAFLQRLLTNSLKQKLEKKRLAKELKLKADFTAMLVHDLRSPLNVVMGYSEMLTEFPDEMDIPKTGKVITGSSEKMLTLINDMLDISKFESGKMSLHRKNVTLFEIVTNIIEIITPLFDKYAQLSTNVKTKGTGLGLAVSKMIIEAHDGTIGYQPGLHGKGSTFYSRLPLPRQGLENRTQM